MWGGVILGYHLASRLAYVVGIGVALRRQDHDQIFTQGHGAAEGFQRFRRWAVILLNNDAASFILLAIVTRNTLAPAIALWLRLSLGLVLMILGVGVKYWAALRVGPGAYYWENFFIPKPFLPLDPPGPYRFLKNPMYTVGYLHAYGFALFCGSWLGLLAAVFDQAAILIFHHRVEKPHFLRLTRGEAP